MRRATVAAAVQLAAAALFLCASYGVLGEGAVGVGNIGTWVLVAFVVPGVTAAIIGRWWSLLLPLGSIVISIPIEVALESGAHDIPGSAGEAFLEITPFAFALLALAPLALLASVVGVLIRRRRDRAARRAATPKGTAH